MSHKNHATPQEHDLSKPDTPDPEVVPQAKRRRFTVEYKLRILEEADRCTEPTGARRESGGSWKRFALRNEAENRTIRPKQSWPSCAERTNGSEPSWKKPRSSLMSKKNSLDSLG